jgi:glutamyl-tRNA reductase
VHLLTIGLSHKTAPVEIREKLSFPRDEIEDALRELLSTVNVSEAVIISTCNRTEIYAVVQDLEGGKKEIVDFLCRNRGVRKNRLLPYLYSIEDRGVVHHLFEVACSLDSMVLGEAQILGQVKEAYDLAFEANATKAIFNRLFRTSFSVGKRVRTETAISESAVSVSYAAVQLAKTVFEELEGREVMIIGAGEMGELTVRHLLSAGVRKVLVTNRTFKRAEELAREFGGEAIPFERRIEGLIKADIVISSTGAPSYILEKEEMAEAMKARRNRPIFLIDIAVPRDIHPEIGKMYNVFLYDIDDLEKVVEANRKEREKEAQKAQKIIEEEVEGFLDWLCTLEVVPTLKSLRSWAEEIKKAEVDEVLKKLSHLSEGEKNLIQALAHGLVNKILHDPTVKLKECAKKKDGYNYVEALRFLFSLEEKEEE